MIQIKNRHDGKVIFEANVSTVKEAVELAVKQKVSLAYADLRGAILRGANLLGADLQGADLRGADLLGADLQGG